jgi:hypothetical protein
VKKKKSKSESVVDFSFSVRCVVDAHSHKGAGEARAARTTIRGGFCFVLFCFVRFCYHIFRKNQVKTLEEGHIIQSGKLFFNQLRDVQRKVLQ